MRKEKNRKEKSMKQNKFAKKKLFLFDIDGTLAVGDTLYKGTKELLDYIAEIQGYACFITNNSTKSNLDYVNRFRTVFGLETREEQFVTSGFMTIRFLKEKYADQLIYVLGTDSFLTELQKNGLQITDVADENAACVVVAFDNELNYNKLTQACKLLLTKEIPFYGTNPDLRCPIEFGFVPDCGAICNMLTETTDKTPIYLGKPSETVVDYCLELTGFTKEETLVVGDRLYTDIACGINGGVETCVLLTGEAKREDLIDTPYKPDYIFENVYELYKACAK